MKKQKEQEMGKLKHMADSVAAGRRLISLLAAMVIVVATLLSPIQTSPAAAATTYGYTWKLEFTYNADLNGLLTVEAGPGAVNALDAVLVTKQYTVPCQARGAAGVAGGHAVFNGGAIACQLHLARAINNAFAACAGVDPACRYELSELEGYSGLSIDARLYSTQPGLAPFVDMPNATFSADVTAADVTLASDLGPAGTMASIFAFVLSPLGTWTEYESDYGCIAGACDMVYTADGIAQSGGAGSGRVLLATAPVNLIIGYSVDGNQHIPPGSMLDWLVIDPSAQGDH